MCPTDDIYEDGVMKCRLVDYTEHWLSWIGRTGGGLHPLGFDVDVCPTLIEFDNYGQTGEPGVKQDGFGVWGYDDITWFTLQPEDYRNHFLKYCDGVLKTTRTACDGTQLYFLQPTTRRTITPAPNYHEHFIFPAPVSIRRIFSRF